MVSGKATTRLTSGVQPCNILPSKPDGIGDTTYRTTRALQVLQYNYLVFPVAFYLIHTCIVAPVFGLDLRPTWTKPHLSGWDLPSIVCLVLLILTQFTIVGTSLMALYPFRPYRWKDGPRTWDFDRMMICLVSNGSNLQAVQRALKSMNTLDKLDHRIQIHFLIEEHSQDKFQVFRDEGIAITTVPITYTTIRATHKARALEYFRTTQRLTERDWVLHLDEETLIDAHVVQTCIDFIQRRERENMMAAQGIIMYNAHQYWDNWLLTAADIIRVIDDFGHFQFQLNCLGKALDGFHGSFLLLNGKAENAVTWETDSIVEDMYFGLEASRLGFECAWLPSFAREQSPFSVKDYLLQRRRWYYGTWALNRLHLRLLFILWVLMPLELVFWPLWVWIGVEHRMPLLLFDLAVLDISLQLTAYGMATSLQGYHAGRDIIHIVLDVLRVIMLLPAIGFIDFLALVYTIVYPPKGFDTISK